MELEHRLALGQNSGRDIIWGTWGRKKTILSRNRATIVFLLIHMSRPEVIIQTRNRYILKDGQKVRNLPQE